MSTVFYAKGVCMEESESSPYCTVLTTTLKVVSVLGFVGFMSNIIQFSLDQLQEASATEITSFIVWYTWSWNCSLLIGHFLNSGFCGKYKLIATLFFPASASLAVCLDSTFSHWFVKEPVASNPFKLFLGVLRYAVRNKYPRLRSAFTYWEDKPYTRIDLAKDKYGGPFTTEQVEDVKIVLRIFVIVANGCIGLGLCFVLAGNFDIEVLRHLGGTGDACSGKNVLPSYKLFATEFSSYLASLLYIPIHEFLIYPLFWKYIAQWNSISKFTFGIFLLLPCYISFLLIEAVGYHYTEFHDENSKCFLKEGEQHLSLSIEWYCIPRIIRGIAFTYIFWGCAEFMCSQTPYAMRGVIFGSTYLLFGLSLVLINLLLLPVWLTAKNWHPVMYGCGVWFYLCVIVFYVIFTLVCIFVFKKVYKMRRRDEDLHNRHIFAINYYSHYIQYNKEIGTKP
jgi:peptide/histidine transporter 3/4